VDDDGEIHRDVHGNPQPVPLPFHKPASVGCPSVSNGGPGALSEREGVAVPAIGGNVLGGVAEARSREISRTPPDLGVRAGTFVDTDVITLV
jgi:hypothetical protein